MVRATFVKPTTILVFLIVTVVLVIINPTVQANTTAHNVQAPEEDTSGRQCCLIANYNMHTGRPYVRVVSDSRCPHPVVCETSVPNDTTVCLSLFLPHTWPDRHRQFAETRFPAGAFHLHISSNGDSAHYRVDFDSTADCIQLEPIKRAPFLKELKPHSYPPRMVMIQLQGKDYQLASDLTSELSPAYEKQIIEPGYYLGVPEEITVSRLGTERFNATADGLLLVFKLDRSFDERCYQELRNIVDKHHLSWYYPILSSEQ